MEPNFVCQLAFSMFFGLRKDKASFRFSERRAFPETWLVWHQNSDSSLSFVNDPESFNNSRVSNVRSQAATT
jgi:hypothetical protein